MGTVIIGLSVLAVGVIMYFTFKPTPKEKVATVENNIPIESPENSEEAVITEKPVVKRVYKKREKSEGVRNKSNTGESKQ